MEPWQILLKNGNVSFDNEQWSQAEGYYQQAVSCLESLWLEDLENIKLLMAWISSFHNLSVLYEVQGKSQIALHYLLVPHQRMVQLSQDEYFSDDLHSIAMQALKVTLMPILAFSKKYPTCDNCQQSLRKIELMLEESQPVIH